MNAALLSVGCIYALSGMAVEPAGRAPCIHALLHRLTTRSVRKTGWFCAGAPQHPPAYLNLGRAAKLEGDIAKSKKACQDFLNLWKDDDPVIPILIEARAEYTKLK
jgi:hypothetical protein